MDSLWRSFAQSATRNKSMSDAEHPRLTSSLQAILIRLSCSRLPNMSIDGNLTQYAGAYLARGATYSVERREAEGYGLVAVKHILQDLNPYTASHSHSSTTRYRLNSVLLEVQALLHGPLQQHPNIARLMGFGWDEGGLPYLVMEYASLGSAQSFLRQQNRSLEEKVQLMSDIASGLHVLHRCEIIHGDVKLENVLIMSDSQHKFNAKLSDFGFCCSEALGNNIYLGTRLLNAPELRSATDFDPLDGRLAYMRCDVYSYGLAAWETINNGERFYSIDEIGISPEDLDKAESFLSRLDCTGRDLIPHAHDFVRSLNLSDSISGNLMNVFTMALCRHPEQRSEIPEIRRQLIGIDSEEDEESIVLRAPRYSIFEISEASVPWSLQSKLVSNLSAGARDHRDPFSGQDCFHLAACYAIGFGTELDTTKCFYYLYAAAERNYLPARVLYASYKANGLIDTETFSTVSDAMSGILESLDKDSMSMPSSLQFAFRVRSFYKRQNLLIGLCGVFVGERWFAPGGKEPLMSFLLDQNIKYLSTASVHFDVLGKRVQKPLMHYLIAAYEEFAESLLRKGFDGSMLAENDVSLLNIACSCGSARIVHTLLELFPSLALQPSKDGITPLHWLFMFEDEEVQRVARTLAAYHASLSAIGVMELVDFNLIFSGRPLEWAIMARNAIAVRALIDAGTHASESSEIPPNCEPYPSYPVNLAACLLMPEIVQILISNGAEIGTRIEEPNITTLQFVGECIDPFRLWLYHGAHVQEATSSTIQVLLDNGSKIDDSLDDGTTALEWIATRTTCLTSVIQALLKYEPRVTTEGRPARTSAMYGSAVSLQHQQLNATKFRLILEYSQQKLEPEEFKAQCIESLKMFARHGTVAGAREVLATLLPHEKAIIDEEELLHFAAERGHVQMIELLLDLGADVNFGPLGTAAAAAASHAKTGALNALLSRGASVLSMRSSDPGISLLHELASNGSPPQDAFRALCYIYEHFRHLFRPVVNNYDAKGFTALHEAVIGGHLEIISLLLEKFEADPSFPVRGTKLSLSTFAALVQLHPPWYVYHFGDGAVTKHVHAMSNVLNYLASNWSLGPPDAEIRDHSITFYWTDPISDNPFAADATRVFP